MVKSNSMDVIKKFENFSVYGKHKYLVLLMIILVLQVGPRWGRTDLKRLAKLLYMSTNPTAECAQVVNSFEDNPELDRLIATLHYSLLYPDQCEAYMQELASAIQSSFFTEELLNSLNIEMITDERNITFLTIDRAEFENVSSELNASAEDLENSLGVRIGGDSAPMDQIVLGEIYPIDLSNTRAILSNGKDSVGAEVAGPDVIFKVWMSEPTSGDEEDENGNSRNYPPGLFPQFMKINGVPLNEYYGAMGVENKLWTLIDTEGNYRVVDGPISDEAYSAIPFLWRWDPGSSSLEQEEYLLGSVMSARVTDEIIKDRRPITGIGIDADGNHFVVVLPFYLFTDLDLTRAIGARLSEVGIVSIGFGDLKMSNIENGISVAGVTRKTTVDPAEALGNIPSALYPQDPFTDGPAFLTIYKKD